MQSAGQVARALLCRFWLTRYPGRTMLVPPGGVRRCTCSPLRDACTDAPFALPLLRVDEEYFGGHQGGHQ